MTFAMKLDYVREIAYNEGYQEGYEEGFKEGYQEGLDEVFKEDLILSLLDILSPEQIAERVELPLKHVLELLEHRP